MHGLFFWMITAWKVSKYGGFSGPYFPVFERKGETLDVKCKGYDSSFNSWIDKKELFLKNDLFSTL